MQGKNKNTENIIRFRHDEQTIEHIRNDAAQKNLNFSEYCRMAFNQGLKDVHGVDLYNNKPVETRPVAA